MKKPKGQAKAVPKDSASDKSTKRPPLRGRVKVPPVNRAYQGGKPNDITWHEPFLAALGQTANVTAACRSCKVSRNIAYDHKAKFPEFREAWEEAEELALDKLYSVGLDHATNGTERPVFQGGKRVGAVIEYDHGLLQWLLERKRPAQFGAKNKLELSGKITMTEEEELAVGAEAFQSVTQTIRHAAMQGKKI